MSYINTSTTNSPVQTPTGNRSIQGYTKSNSSSIHDIKQMLPNQFQQQQSQQPVPSQFEITSISCTTGINENEEKSSRFRRVKIETEKNKETTRKYARGRWSVNDYYDAPDSINKQNNANEQIISANNYTTTNSTNFQTIQNSIQQGIPFQPTPSSVLVTSTSTINDNTNYNNIVNFVTTTSLPGINLINNSLVQDKTILINTSFEPLTTATANEFANNISPPLAKTIEVNSQNENLEDKQKNVLNQSKSPTLHVPTPISTTSVATNNINIQQMSNNINASSTLTQLDPQHDAPQNEPTNQIGPIATNVVIGSKNSVFQTQSVTNTKKNSLTTINQQAIHQIQLANQTQASTIQQSYPNITQPLNHSNQSQSSLQFQQTQYISNMQLNQQNQSDNNVNANIAQLNVQHFSNNNALLQSNITTHPIIQTSYQNQVPLPAYNSCSTAPILNLNHGQKQPFASQFSSQNVSPKEQNGLAAIINTPGQTSSVSSIVSQVHTSNNNLPLLTTTAPTASGIKDFLNLASTKTSSSSTSSTNDLLSEAYEMLNKKPLTNQDGESERKNDGTAGIHNRIELAMDLVKSHLTNAVKEEIISLKSHIEKLNEKCARLEEENRIFRQYVTPEVLMLIENGNRPSSATNQNHPNTNNLNNFILNQTQSINFSSSTTSASSSSSMSSAMITTNVLNNNISATMSPSALSVTDTNLNTSGDDNSSMSELLTPVLNSNSILTNINNSNNDASNSVFNENSSNMSI